MYLVSFQSGGGGGEMAAVVAEAVTLHCLKIHGSWVMEVVSKTLFFCVCGHSRNNHSDHFLFHSNYDRWYYHKQNWIPMDSSLDLEDHEYGPEDPWTLPWLGE